MSAQTTVPANMDADGTITLQLEPGEHLLQIANNMGGGTLSLTHRGIALEDGEFTDADLPVSRKLTLSAGPLVMTLANSTAPDLDVDVSGISGRAASQAGGA